MHMNVRMSFYYLVTTDMFRSMMWLAIFRVQLQLQCVGINPQLIVR